MPTAPAASRPTRLHPVPKKSSTMPPPSKPAHRNTAKPSAPKRSASAPTPARAHFHREQQQRHRSPTPKTRPAQPPVRSRSTPIPRSSNNNPKSAARPTPRIQSRSAGQKPSSRSQSTVHRHNNNRRTEHVHATYPHGSSKSRPTHVVCNRKHYDDGFYARCQRLLRRYVKWGE